MYTFQDFQKDVTASGVEAAVSNAIANHRRSDAYLIAKDADEYDHQRNTTITNYIKTIFTMAGTPVEDFTASNNKLCSNFFHRLNTQRLTYLLGNGISFTDHVEEVVDEGGDETQVDETKEMLGPKFDTDLQTLAYASLIHGVSFGFWNIDRLHIFPLTEFAPLWDEETGSLMAGIRFWQIDSQKPMYAVLYEIDGYTKLKCDLGNNGSFVIVDEQKPYAVKVATSEEGGEEVIGEYVYSQLPIIPMWGSKLKQSTLVGMKEKIDSFDLIRSGFANDLTDCAQVYWILENCGGMTAGDLEKFRDRLKINHIAVVQDADNSKAEPYTQDIPYAARKEYLDEIRAGIYEDFGGLDVHTIAAGATNDHIDAAYQPMDEEADDFEYQIIEFIDRLLELLGTEDTPIFKRNRISNQKEQTEMVLSAADYLDTQTILSKLPFVTVDEVAEILARKDAEAADRFEPDMNLEKSEPEEEEGPDETDTATGESENELVTARMKRKK